MVYEGIGFEAGDVAYFHFTSSLGTDSVVKVVVFTSPVLDFWATTSPICKGSTDGVIDFWDNVDITAPYEFSLDGGLTYYDEYTYPGLPAGHYELRARNRVGCVFEYELTISEYPKLQLDVPAEVVSCDESVEIAFSMKKRPPIPHTFQWAGPSGDVLSTDSVFHATQPGTYTLTVTNECETVKRNIKVRMEEGPSDLQLYMPNSFSPNGDGINDCLQVHIAPSAQLLGFQLLVFDRWGGEVFRSNDAADCWDGTRRGKDLNPATFIWQVSVKLQDCFGMEKSVVKKGGLTLLR